MARDLQDLLAGAAVGDPGTLDELVARYLSRLHGYVRFNMGPKLRAQEASVDVVQSVCREVLEERGQFEFQGEGPFLSWLLTAAMNKLRDRARFYDRERRSPEREVERLDEEVHPDPSPSQEVMKREDVDRLESALEGLPDDHREVIVLARIVGLAHADIAEQMGRSVRAVRSLLARALAGLGDQFPPPSAGPG